MSETVYLVSQGEYSDYCIVAAFSSREKAEAFVAERTAHASASIDGDGEWKLSDGAGMDIEEYALDEVTAPQRGCFRVELYINSPYTSLGIRGVYARWIESGDPSARATATRDISRPEYITVTGFGESREHARRSAADLHRGIVAGTVIVP